MIRIELNQVIVRADEMVTYKNLRYAHSTRLAFEFVGNFRRFLIEIDFSVVDALTLEKCLRLSADLAKS